jgi:hypothetical protein
MKARMERKRGIDARNGGWREEEKGRIKRRENKE